MSPRPSSAPSHATALLDDFEWPPAADNVSVHEIEADPWRIMEVDDADDAADVIFEPDPPFEPEPPAPVDRPASGPHRHR
jgi:hypothetical protein